MEERERPDFQQYVPKKVSKAYVFKIFLYRKLKQQDKTKVNSPKIEQIDHVKIDSPDQ